MDIGPYFLPSLQYFVALGPAEIGAPSTPLCHRCAQPKASPQRPPPSCVSQAHWRVHASRWRSSWARVPRCPTPSGFGHRRVAGELQCFDPGRGLGRRVGGGEAV